MRKYTQLCLVIITVISVIVLLMYRNEYKQLKYVLDVVNFIGRKDEIALVRLENQTNFYQHSPYEFNSPLPIWQRIGSGFHAYSSFWIRPNDLKEGGEIITMVVGLKHSIVSFKCEANYPNNRMQKGKFVFIREEVIGDDPNEFATSSENFIIYKFVCKIGRDYGKPVYVSFTDISTKGRHQVRVRDLQRKHINELLTMTLCVDLIPRNQTEIDVFTNNDFNLLQFFVHHQLIGIDEFLVYDSGVISSALKQTLFAHGIKLNIFPFNFPFELGHRTKTKKIIEMDCLLRTSNSVKFTSILTPRDFLYTNGNLASTPQPLLQMLKDAEFVNNVEFEVISNPICMHKMKKILSDNLLVSTNANVNGIIKLYKTNNKYNRNSNVVISSKTAAMRIGRNLIFNNHYLDCDVQHSERADENLVEWRSTISNDFRQFVDQIGVKLNGLLRSAQ